MSHCLSLELSVSMSSSQSLYTLAYTHANIHTYIHANTHTIHSPFFSLPPICFMCSDLFKFVCDLCVIWLSIHVCVMIHSCVCHDSIMCAPWPIMMCMCVMKHSYVRHDSSIRAPWLSDIYSMTPAYVPWLIHIQWYVSRRTRTRWYRTLINTTQTNKVTKSKRNPFSAASHQSLWRAGPDTPPTNIHYPRNHLSSLFTISFYIFPKVSFRVPLPLSLLSFKGNLYKTKFAKLRALEHSRHSLSSLGLSGSMCVCMCMCGQYVFDSRGTCVCMCVWESKYVFARVFMTWHVRGCACVCACMCMHTWACYGMYKDALCHAHEWVMSNDTHIIKAGRTFVSITSIVWMSHVTRTNKVVTRIHQGAGWKARHGFE